MLSEPPSEYPVEQQRENFPEKNVVYNFLIFQPVAGAFVKKSPLDIIVYI
jgi:hypothetical protein